MSALSIGLSSLLTSQRLLALTGQNIANANTPGYHRQVAELAPRVAGSAIGLGVELKGITRAVDRLLDDAILRNRFAESGASTTLTGLQQLEAYVAPGEGSLHDALEKFFNEVERLTGQPDNLTQRRLVLAAADTLANRINSTADNLKDIRSALALEAQSHLEQVNDLAKQIARLNQQIHGSAALGDNPIGLLDQRDQVLSQLADVIDVRTIPQGFGEVNVFAAGTPLVLGSSAVTLEARTTDQRISLHVAGAQQTLDITGGKLGGVLSLHNTILPGVRGQFDDLARGLIRQFDQIHATGVGLEGPLQALTSQRTVGNTGWALDDAGLKFPPTAGEVSVTITHLATGARSMQRINVDLETQSLADVAAALSAIPHLQAVVDAQAGSLNLVAAQGFGFDFTGNFSTQPDSQAITGTAAATFTGRYGGTANDTLEFRVIGSGTVGVTPGLALEVRDGAGAILRTLDIGQGYEAGTSLPDVLGVRLKLTAGTLNAGDTFELDVSADPDTAGLLPALGLNSFFTGDDAGGLRVRSDLLAHPERFALSVSGQPGDGTNLTRLLDLRTQPVLKGLTFRQSIEAMIGDVGSQTQNAAARQAAYETLGLELERQRQSISGVDPNEELMRLVQYQRGYQLSARFIAAVNQMLDELFQII